MYLKFEDGASVSSQVEPGQRMGYYLVRESDSARYFISRQVNSHALEKVCKERLGGDHGFGYWIDLSLGLDVHGVPAWVNIDQTDLFMDQLMAT